MRDQVPGLGVMGEILQEIETPVEVGAVEQQPSELDREKAERDRPEETRPRWAPGDDPTNYARPRSCARSYRVEPETPTGSGAVSRTASGDVSKQ